MKVKFEIMVKIYLKNIFQANFWCKKRYYKVLNGASAKTSVLKIISDCFPCQLIALLFMKYSINSSRISFVSITALLPHLGFSRVLPNLVHSPKKAGNRSLLLFFASTRSGG